MAVFMAWEKGELSQPINAGNVFVLVFRLGFGKQGDETVRSEWGTGTLRCRRREDRSRGTSRLQPGHGQGRAAFRIYLRLLPGNFKELLHTLSHWWTPSSNLAFVQLSDGVLCADYVASAHSFGVAHED